MKDNYEKYFPIAENGGDWSNCQERICPNIDPQHATFIKIITNHYKNAEE